jgi:hypothetical protein
MSSATITLLGAIACLLVLAWVVLGIFLQGVCNDGYRND